MNREELLKSEEYWTVQLQNKLFQVFEDYMQENNLNRSQLSQKLGCTRGYVTQVLNGDYDHKISKLVSLALAVGKVPIIEFRNIDEILRDDKTKSELINSSRNSKVKSKV